MIRRTKKQVAADMLAHQKQEALALALSNLADAFLYADLAPPILTMTREERNAIFDAAPDYYSRTYENSFGWESLCSRVKIIERKSNG